MAYRSVRPTQARRRDPRVSIAEAVGQCPRDTERDPSHDEEDTGDGEPDHEGTAIGRNAFEVEMIGVALRAAGREEGVPGTERAQHEVYSNRALEVRDLEARVWPEQSKATLAHAREHFDATNEATGIGNRRGHHADATTALGGLDHRGGVDLERGRRRDELVVATGHRWREQRRSLREAQRDEPTQGLVERAETLVRVADERPQHEPRFEAAAVEGTARDAIEGQVGGFEPSFLECCAGSSEVAFDVAMHCRLRVCWRQGMGESHQGHERAKSSQPSPHLMAMVVEWIPSRHAVRVVSIAKAGISLTRLSGRCTSCNLAAVQRAEATLERFGRYELRQELASGGMASVWLARTTAAGGFVHVCAVKRVHPHLAKQAQFVDMFLDEARIAARIRHANVCRVFDFGQVEGVPFIAMEYLAGVPFSAIIAGLARDVRADRLVAACALVGEAAAGLHAAHELRDANGRLLDVVHRDVSPQNLFLTFDGVVKVVDFGIASARDKVHDTQTGEVKGKLAYMPPEQMRGLRVDRRADVWSLGVVLWEFCCVARLFRRASQPETMDAVLNADIDVPSQREADVPPALDAIVMRALSRDPAERFATAGELSEALDDVARELGGPWGRARLERWVTELFPEKIDESTTLVSGVLSDLDEDVSEVRWTDPGGGEFEARGESNGLADAEPTRAAVPRNLAVAHPEASEEAPLVHTPNRARKVRPSVRGALAAGAVVALCAVVIGAWTVFGRNVGRGDPGRPRAAPAPAPRAEVVAPPIKVTPAEPRTGIVAGSMEPATSFAAPSGPRSTAEPRLRRSEVATPHVQAPVDRSPPPASPPEEVTREPGCIRVGLGVAARIEGERIDGPRMVRVASGSVPVALLDPATGTTASTRTVLVTPGESCARLVAGE